MYAIVASLALSALTVIAGLVWFVISVGAALAGAPVPWHIFMYLLYMAIASVVLSGIGLYRAVTDLLREDKEKFLIAEAPSV